MDTTTFNFWGTSKYWWSLLILGLLIIAGGFWLLYQPVIGYATIALLFGWLLLVGGIFQIVISTSIKKEMQGWGWWLAGGILDVLIGLLLVMNLALTEASLPYFFAFIFLFKGITNLIAAFSMTSTYKYWWLYLINGILLLVLSWLFFISPFAAAFTIVVLCSFVMIYWGISLIVFSFDVKPSKNDRTIEVK